MFLTFKFQITSSILSFLTLVLWMNDTVYVLTTYINRNWFTVYLNSLVLQLFVYYNNKNLKIATWQKETVASLEHIIFLWHIISKLMSSFYYRVKKEIIMLELFFVCLLYLKYYPNIFCVCGETWNVIMRNMFII